MYTDYVNYLQSNINIDNDHFKSNTNYNGILEHVSYELGSSYIKLIEEEFPNITYENIIGFVELNDKYGFPNKNMFLFKYLNIIECSPTSLRYIYHALTILNHYNTTDCENMVEVGCGYGGLCLSIQYFANILNIHIKKYNIVDLPEACNLITKYLAVFTSTIMSEIEIHSSDTYGKNIHDPKLFFISNYCYTEIEKEHNRNYTSYLLNNTQNGFITWQNGGNKGAYPIENSSIITGKDIKTIIEEKPQTDSGIGIYKNFFVYF